MQTADKQTICLLMLCGVSPGVLRVSNVFGILSISTGGVWAYGERGVPRIIISVFVRSVSDTLNEESLTPLPFGIESLGVLEGGGAGGRDVKYQMMIDTGLCQLVRA